MRTNNKPISVPRALTLREILNRSTPGFTRLSVLIDECKVSDSKKGKLRFVVLVERKYGDLRRVHECYVAATMMMFRKYRIGDAPQVSTPSEPEYKGKYQCVFNHTKEVYPTMIHKYLEFIHTQAEMLYRAHKDNRWFSVWDTQYEQIR